MFNKIMTTIARLLLPPLLLIALVLFYWALLH